MADLEGLDLAQIKPGQFVALVSDLEEADLLPLVRAVGVEAVVDRIFDGMTQQLDADRASDARVRFVVTDEGESFTRTIEVAAGSAKVTHDDDEVRTTISLDLGTFFQLITGNANGVTLFMGGKLKLAGDMLFAQQFNNWFKIPDAER